MLRLFLSRLRAALRTHGDSSEASRLGLVLVGVALLVLAAVIVWVAR